MCYKSELTKMYKGETNQPIEVIIYKMLDKLLINIYLIVIITRKN